MLSIPTRQFRVVPVVLSCVFAASVASGAVQSIRITPVADTEIKFDEPTRNFSSQPYTDITAGKQRIPLMRFDLSSIPSGSAIVSAVLTLQFSQVGMPTAQFDVGVYNVCKPFDPGTVTYTNYAAGSPWASPGLELGQDYFCGAAPLRGNRRTDLPLQKTIDLTALASAAMGNKAGSMDLALLFEAGSIYAGATIYNNISADPATWPSLTIQYDPTSPHADPGSQTLLTSMTPFQLDGSRSSRPNGTTAGLVYQWTFASVPPISRIAAGTVIGTTPGVSAVPDAPGDYTFALKVTDPATLESGSATVTDAVWNLQSHPRLGINGALRAQLRQLVASGDPAWTRYSAWVATAKANPNTYTSIGTTGTGLLLNYVINNDTAAFTEAWQSYLPQIYNNGDPGAGLRPFYGSCPQANYCDDHSAAFLGGGAAG